MSSDFKKSVVAFFAPGYSDTVAGAVSTFESVLNSSAPGITSRIEATAEDFAMPPLVATEASLAGRQYVVDLAEIDDARVKGFIPVIVSNSPAALEVLKLHCEKSGATLVSSVVVGDQAYNSGRMVTTAVKSALSNESLLDHTSGMVVPEPIAGRHLVVADDSGALAPNAYNALVAMNKQLRGNEIKQSFSKPTELMTVARLFAAALRKAQARDMAINPEQDRPLRFKDYSPAAVLEREHPGIDVLAAATVLLKEFDIGLRVRTMQSDLFGGAQAFDASLKVGPAARAVMSPELAAALEDIRFNGDYTRSAEEYIAKAMVGSSGQKPADLMASVGKEEQYAELLLSAAQSAPRDPKAAVVSVALSPLSQEMFAAEVRQYAGHDWEPTESLTARVSSQAPVRDREEEVVFADADDYGIDAIDSLEAASISRGITGGP